MPFFYPGEEDSLNWKNTSLAEETAPVITGVQYIPSGGPSHLKRIEGYDAARAIAVFGMVVVNFYVIFPGIDAFPDWYKEVAAFLFGRAAALFVMLAGVGLSLMSRRAYLSRSRSEHQKVRNIIFKRSVILLLMGMLFMQWWSADILHFYGLYLTAGALLLNVSGRRLWTLILITLLSSTLLYCLADGTPALEEWITAPGLLTAIVDDLLFNGYYPVFPWMVFLLVGMWIGRIEIVSDAGLKRALFFWALAVMIISELATRYLPQLLFEGAGAREEGMLDMLLTSEVFPVTPMFSLSAAAGSIIVIMAVMTMSRYRLFSRFSGSLECTGKLSLTIYIAHIFIGYGMQRILALHTGNHAYQIISASFPFGFCLAALYASKIWFKYFDRGPLEWLMRRLSNSG